MLKKIVFLQENITIHKGCVANWKLSVKQNKKVPETRTFNVSNVHFIPLLWDSRPNIAPTFIYNKNIGLTTVWRLVYKVNKQIPICV